MRRNAFVVLSMGAVVGRCARVAVQSVDRPPRLLSGQAAATGSVEPFVGNGDLPPIIATPTVRAPRSARAMFERLASSPRPERRRDDESG